MGITNADGKPLKFLALGDSYTIGEGVQAAERWPVQLVGSLRERGWMVADPLIVAQTGWTTAELKGAILQAGLAPGFHLVSLLVGVNNQYRGLSPEMYQGEFQELLQTAIQFAWDQPKRALVLSIPDWSVTPFAAGRNRHVIAGEIDVFNALNLVETEKLGARYVDVTMLSRIAASDNNMIAHDGLHPSGKMYTEWVKLMMPAAIQAISI